jgi:predicted RNase H-like nuclease
VNGPSLESELEQLASLLHERNEVDARIARLTGRPCQIGHLGEFIASRVFGIELHMSAAHAGSDGVFLEGPLRGKSVNVKWYGKHEGILDLSEHPPDFYLVLAGPRSAALSSRGGSRPLVIDYVFLLEATPLLEALRARGMKVGVATSVARTLWDAAEVYPRDSCLHLRLSEGQRRLLQLFSSPSRQAHGSAPPATKPGGDTAAHLDRRPAAWVAGADGFRGGWVIILRRLDASETRLLTAPDFAGLLDRTSEAVFVAVDIPIGLLDHPRAGGRPVDGLARKLLGAKGSSVFPAPPRCVFEARSYEDANKQCRALGGPALSRQSWAIVPKIADADRHMTPSLQGRVLEVHPELCFLELNRGVPVLSRKKDLPGRDERLRLLREQGGFAEVRELLSRSRPSGVGDDDLLDAYAACWTAGRVAREEAVRLPPKPTADNRGLRMEMWR